MRRPGRARADVTEGVKPGGLEGRRRRGNLCWWARAGSRFSTSSVKSVRRPRLDQERCTYVRTPRTARGTSLAVVASTDVGFRYFFEPINEAATEKRSCFLSRNCTLHSFARPVACVAYFCISAGERIPVRKTIIQVCNFAIFFISTNPAINRGHCRRKDGCGRAACAPCNVTECGNFPL